MAKLTIVADFKVSPDHVEFVRSQLERIIPLTRAEKGCLQYDLHLDNEDSTHFMFFENWESRELWQDHIDSQHIAEYRSATEGMIDDFKLFEMTHVA